MHECNPKLWINPVDAKNPGIEYENIVKLKSKSGEIDMVAKITEDVLPGVVFAHMHNPKINHRMTVTTGLQRNSMKKGTLWNINFLSI